MRLLSLPSSLNDAQGSTRHVTLRQSRTRQDALGSLGSWLPWQKQHGTARIRNFREPATVVRCPTLVLSPFLKKFWGLSPTTSTLACPAPVNCCQLQISRATSSEPLRYPAVRLCSFQPDAPLSLPRCTVPRGHDSWKTSCCPRVQMRTTRELNPRRQNPAE